MNTENITTAAEVTAEAIQTAETVDLSATEITGTAEAIETTGTSLEFEPSNFVDNLGYMGSGMLGIFVVIGIIVGITYILNAVSKKKQ